MGNIVYQSASLEDLVEEVPEVATATELVEIAEEVIEESVE
jgi:hypothetical protein